MQIDFPLYYASNIILRKEYFGGIVFLIEKGRYFEINKSAYSFLEGLGNSPILLDNLSKLYGMFNEYTVEQFLRECIEQDILCSTETTYVLRRVVNVQTDNYISAPIEAYLYLTRACNQNCSFCYFKKYAYEDNLTYMDWCRVIDQLEAHGACTIGFLGGEPFVKKDLLLALLKYTEGKAWRTITTNGTAYGGIDDDLAMQLASFQSLEVNISIESIDPVIHDHMVGLPGAYICAIQSLRNLVKYNVPVTVKTAATQTNYSGIYELAKVAKEIGANGFYILDYMPSYGEGYSTFSNTSVPNDKYWELVEKCETLASQDFFVLANTKYRFLYSGSKFKEKKGSLLYHSSKCSAGSINLDIMPNGDTYSCPLTNGQEKYQLGNILNQSIYEIWHSKVLDVFRRRLPQNLLNSNCRSCVNRDSCIGGCPISAEIFTGSTYGGDIRCPDVYMTSLQLE